MTSPRTFRRGRRLTPVSVGLIVIGVGLALAAAITLTPQLRAWLAPGEVIRAEFRENYRGRLQPYKSTVKLAGIQVGRVLSIERTDHDTTIVAMKVDEEMPALGPAPSAAIEPLTILGGGFAVELYRGGGPGAFDPDTVIPTSRTRVPVELDPILEALPRPARASLQGMVGGIDATLAGGGREALRQLLLDAPATLEPAGAVLTAVQGSQPERDLPTLVTGLEATARVLSTRGGQLGSIMHDLHITTGVLAAQSRSLRDTVARLPLTLEHTRTGLSRLDGTLQRLGPSARAFRPAARRLRPLVDRLIPVLEKARPLLRDARPLLDDARPTLNELSPVSERATDVFRDLRGPVLNRVNGPVLSTLLGTYRGTGPYQGSGGGAQADHRFYQELAYMATGLGRASQTQDANGALLNFQFGAGSRTPSLGGLTFEQPLRPLLGPTAPAGAGPGMPRGGNPLTDIFDRSIGAPR